MDTGELPRKGLRRGKEQEEEEDRGGICEWGSSPRPLAGRRAVRGVRGGCQAGGETPKGLALRVGVEGGGKKCVGWSVPLLGSDTRP